MDLIFAFLICPAIVDPEQHGITDAPVSYVARFNLIQVAQILQVLASRKYQEVDPKVWDLYSQFDKDTVSSLVDGLLEGAVNGLLEEPVISESCKLQGLSRSAALLTEAELYGLVWNYLFFYTISSCQSCFSISLCSLFKGELPTNCPS